MLGYSIFSSTTANNACNTTPPSSPSKWDVRLSFGHRRPQRCWGTRTARYVPYVHLHPPQLTPHPQMGYKPSTRHHYLITTETMNKNNDDDGENNENNHRGKDYGDQDQDETNASMN